MFPGTIHRPQHHAFHQQADGDNDHHKQQCNPRDNNQAGDEIAACVFIQAFGVLLMYRQHLVEHDFILAVELRNGGDERVKCRDVVGCGGINQRLEPLIAVGLPGLLIGANQRCFIRQTR